MHRFSVGQIVIFQNRFDRRQNKESRFQVTGLVPNAGEGPQYRLKALQEAHERVALERDLTLDGVEG